VTKNFSWGKSRGVGKIDSVGKIDKVTPIAVGFYDGTVVKIPAQ
jgi:hypothetical protein